MRLIDLAEVGELPFALWCRWYWAEGEVPFLDRRIELEAFLICRVLAAVIHERVEPTQEMFELSPAIEANSAPEGDSPEVDHASIALFGEKMDQQRPR